MNTTRWGVGIGLIVFAVIAVVVTAVASASGSNNRLLGGGWLGHASSARASAGPAQLSGRSDGELRLVFVQSQVLTNSPGGFDDFAVSGPVRRQGTTVGFGIVRCAIAAPDQGLGDCSGTFNLGGSFPHGGQITIHGMTSSATHWFNAITGGTGRFAHASGQVEARNIGTTNRIGLIFHLG